MRRLSLLNQRGDQPVKPKKFILCIGRAFSGFTQECPVFLMSFAPCIHFFLQRTERPIPAAVTNVGRLCVTGTSLLFKVRAVQIAYGATTADLELLR
jgi:hypothetical protein